MWRKGVQILQPPRFFPLWHKNYTLVAAGFFIKDAAMVGPLSSTHLVCSWVIYRPCQPLQSLFTLTLTYTQNIPLHVCLLFAVTLIESVWVHWKDESLRTCVRYCYKNSCFMDKTWISNPSFPELNVEHTSCRVHESWISGHNVIHVVLCGHFKNSNHYCAKRFCKI